MGHTFHGGPGDAENVMNYNKIKVGVKSLEDAVYNLGDLIKNGNRNLANKGLIMKALADNDLETLRQVSNYFYKTNGIYQKACNYFALYQKYWMKKVKVIRYSKTLTKF